MKDLDLKQNVLQEIMDLMDEREANDLKAHPKLMAAKVEVEKPAEDELEAELESAPAEEQPSEDEVTPEMLQKLLEHFQDLK